MHNGRDFSLSEPLARVFSNSRKNYPDTTRSFKINTLDDSRNVKPDQHFFSKAGRGFPDNDVDCVRIRIMQDALSSQDQRLSPVTCVSDFVLRIRQILEANVPLCWVSGEVSSLTRAASGHFYFTLKDARAQIRCTMWRSRAQLLPFQLREGMQVEARGLVGIYEARGDLQFSVESIRRAGLGNLYEAFLRLKAYLEAEGLFDVARKRPLPRLPRGLGIITSPKAAALHDVLSTLTRRAPALPCVLYPTPVQGDGAGTQIAAAIQQANTRAKRDGVELLILCRGGGSLEDLWAFNEEAVVRALATSQLPVICGVGHETDTTLADFAADCRAATPTAAAELASAGWHELAERLPLLARGLERSLYRRLDHAAQHLDRLAPRLIHPRTRIERHAERLENLNRRLGSVWRQLKQKEQAHLESLAHRLAHSSPRLDGRKARLDSLEKTLQSGMLRRLEQTRDQLDHLHSGLTHLNPDAVLQRGYAIVRDENGFVVRKAKEIENHARIDIQFIDGHLPARVECEKQDPA